jgi:DNA invertase Pin-like site-specific DNA recombinase
LGVHDHWNAQRSDRHRRLDAASGAVARPGFERLVASLCAGEVGAVLCFDASRLSRNGRDWHHLFELCGLVGARVFDPDSVYDPCRPNDRLLLGMKGSIGEFELGILRSRMLDAARSKARRGELRIPLPMGLDPDRRVQEVTRRIFQGFRELGRECIWRSRSRGCISRARRTARE